MSSPGSIIVYMPVEGHARRLVPVANSLAGRGDGKVTGLHVIPPVQIYADAAVAIGAEYVQSQTALFREDADRARAAFEAEAAACGLDAAWREGRTSGQPYIGEVATACRTSDLVIAGQPDEEGVASGLITPADIIMACGRPVLVVPAAGSFDEVGNRILIGWNGSREAARAAFDALALCQEGTVIRILSAGAGGDSDEPHASGAVLAAALARHGHETDVHRTNPRSITVAEEILSRAADFSADTIVLGCYGHARLRETIFGGVTRDILAHMTVPVLMSH